VWRYRSVRPKQFLRLLEHPVEILFENFLYALNPPFVLTRSENKMDQAENGFAGLAKCLMKIGATGANSCQMLMELLSKRE